MPPWNHNDTHWTGCAPAERATRTIFHQGFRSILPNGYFAFIGLFAECCFLEEAHGQHIIIIQLLFWNYGNSKVWVAKFIAMACFFTPHVIKSDTQK
jgi:hypothetical protein